MPDSTAGSVSRQPRRPQDVAQDGLKRPSVISTRSLTPTTGLSLSQPFDPKLKTRPKPSISSLNTIISEAGSAASGERAKGGEGGGLLMEVSHTGEEGEEQLGTGRDGNAGPSVHLEDSGEGLEGEDGDSDDSDGPPPWITQGAASPSKEKDRADTPNATQHDVPKTQAPSASAPDQALTPKVVKAPVLLRDFTDSQSLLREQLRRNAAAAAPSRFPTTAQASLPAPAPAGAADLSSSIHSEPAKEASTSKRKYYILTSAGKPVWSTEDEEEVDVTGQAGVMQAIISIFADEGDKLRYIDAGNLKIAVMLKPPLYLLAVSDWGEPESVLRLHLEYLHLLVLSIISHTQLTRIFERRSNFDLRRSLYGTEPLFEYLASRLPWDLSVLTGSLEVFRCEQHVREEVGKQVTPNTERSKDLLYALVIAGGKVVTLVRPKRHSVHPSDLHILTTTILASASLRSSESWLPICLPRYNATGFLHAHVSFPHPHLGLVFVSGDREGFFGLREWAGEVAQGLQTNENVWNALIQDDGSTEGAQGGGQPYGVGDAGVPGLRHFLYKSRGLVQVTAPAWEGDYEALSHRRRLTTIYQRCHNLMHARPFDSRPPAKFIYLRNDHEAVVGWVTSTYELYMALSPMLSKTAAVSAAHAVIKWVKGEENRLFLTSAPSF